MFGGHELRDFLVLDMLMDCFYGRIAVSFYGRYRNPWLLVANKERKEQKIRDGENFIPKQNMYEKAKNHWRGQQ